MDTCSTGVWSLHGLNSRPARAACSCLWLSALSCRERGRVRGVGALWGPPGTTGRGPWWSVGTPGTARCYPLRASHSCRCSKYSLYYVVALRRVRMHSDADVVFPATYGAAHSRRQTARGQVKPGRSKASAGECVLFSLQCKTENVKVVAMATLPHPQRAPTHTLPRFQLAERHEYAQQHPHHPNVPTPVPESRRSKASKVT